jgi:hypothetical protein
MCDCYQIGGPFIAEDPSCVEHGRSFVEGRATAREKIREALTALLYQTFQVADRLDEAHDEWLAELAVIMEQLADIQ